MMQATLCLKLLRPTAILVALGALAGCGGGSSGDGSSPGPDPSPTTGTIAILFTDAPTDQFCQALATVESIDLLGTNGPTNVFTGPETVDILGMRNYTDVFSIDTAVPIGTYEKIRLTLSDLELVPCDTSEPSQHPKLPGNGKLDLNPRGSFEVIGGESMLIELDMDMEKSLHVHQTGNGKWQFRPVIFVTIRPDDTKLVRVFGQVRDLNGADFELCPTEPASSTDDDDNGMNGDMSGDDDSGQCIDVFGGDASFFDGAGDLVGGPAANGDLLTAIGFLGIHDDSDDSDSRADDLKLDAKVVELGDQGSFDRPIGAVASTPGNDGLFLFDPVDDSYGLDPVTTKFQAGTRIFALGSNAELTTAALQPGTSGQVDGVLTDPVAVPPLGGPLKSALIVLDQNTTPEVSLLDATVKSIVPLGAGADPLVREFSVDYGALTGQCVKTDSATKYLLITESPTSVTVENKTFDTMVAVNDVVDVYGSDDAGCVLADSIQEYVTAP